MFDRVDAKLRARASMKGAYPHPMLVTLVFMLLTSGVYWLVNTLFGGGSAFELMMMLEYVEDPEQLLYYLPMILRASTAGGLLSILFSLYQSVMGFGYRSYGLRLARNEGPGYKCLFDGFAKFGRVLLMEFLIGLFTGLWTLLGMVPYLVLLFTAVFTQSAGMMVVAVLFAVAGTIFGVYMGLRYGMAPYLLIDHPSYTAMECIDESKAMMRGHVGQYFVLSLSFLGWVLLAPFTLGILVLWLNPYMAATEANFYDWLSHGWTGEPVNGPANGPEIEF